jgi:Pentapeptide repeats (8 copies)
MIHSLSLIFRKWLIQFWSLLCQVAAAVAIFAVMLVLTGGNPSGLVVGGIFCLAMMAIIALEIGRQGFSGRKEISPEGKKGQILKAYLTILRLLGVKLLGDRLRNANLSGADLNGARLSGADLNGADLNGANLSGADLSGADLNGANLSGADLSGTDLSGADLNGARLIGANLIRAGLNRADLSGANLNRADLSGANLSGANLKRTIFENNGGLTDSDKLDMQERGAIFVDSPESDIPRFLNR